MGRLNFRDINDWTPSSISVVDKPDHPLAVFEVYEDDEEFVKKSINVEDDYMSNRNNDVKDEEQMVSGPVSFFEKILNRSVVTKSTEPPEKPPAQDNEEDKIMAKLDAMDKKMDSFDERLIKLEKEEDEDDDPVNPDEVVDDGQVVTKSHNTPDEVVDDNVLVTKSREVDPDTELVVMKSEKTLMERIGRKNNGMTW